MAKTMALERVKPIFIRPPRPIIVRRASRVIKKVKHHARRAKDFISSHEIKTALGGAALGFIHKQFPNLPAIPLLGKNGTVALLAYLGRRRVPLANDVLIAALVVSGYELASENKISGPDENGWNAGV